MQSWPPDTVRAFATKTVRMDRIPPATRTLLILNSLVFLAQQLFGETWLIDFMLWPAGDWPAGYADGQLVTVGFMPWQLLSYGFIHGGLSHLLFNMLAIYMFGAALEMVWGSRRTMIYVLGCIAGAGLVQLLVATHAVSNGELYPTVGASGGVFGVLLAFGMQFPNRQVMLLIPPIPMKASTLVVVYGVLELLLGVSGTQSGVAHFAHLGGMAAGFLILQYWRGRWPFRRRSGLR